MSIRDDVNTWELARWKRHAAFTREMKLLCDAYGIQPRSYDSPLAGRPGPFDGDQAKEFHFIRDWESLQKKHGLWQQTAERLAISTHKLLHHVESRVVSSVA